MQSDRVITPEARAFGKIVKKARRALGKTQKELGEETHQNTFYVHQLEKDPPLQSLDEAFLIRLEAALGLREFELLLAAGRIPPSLKEAILKNPAPFLACLRRQTPGE